ncbi:MAG: hypothetical protein R3F59_05840 [Myxococcota bacterium]
MSGDAATPGPWPADAGELARILGAIDAAVGAGALHVAVARLHELANALPTPVPDAVRRAALIALHPFVPQWVEARWPAVYGALEAQPWPAPDVGPQQRRVAVQVDGRTVTSVTVAAGASEEDVRAAAHERIVARLQGRGVVRTVFVPDRLLNLVTR